MLSCFWFCFHVDVSELVLRERRWSSCLFKCTSHSLKLAVFCFTDRWSQYHNDQTFPLHFSFGSMRSRWIKVFVGTAVYLRNFYMQNTWCPKLHPRGSFFLFSCQVELSDGSCNYTQRLHCTAGLRVITVLPPVSTL